MKRPWVWLCFLLLIASANHARAVDCSTTRHSEPRVTVCHVDLTRENLRLFWDDEREARGRGKSSRGFDRLRHHSAKQGETLSFAMNAGMFHPDSSPVGLLVIDGVTLSPLNRATGVGNFFLQPNGIFYIGPDGAWVVATKDFDQVFAQPLIATQSGPMLLYRGEIPDIPAFESKVRHIRNGVCATARERIVFVITEEPATLREFAEYFRDALKCDDALYLDGAISSLYSRALERSDSRAQLGPILAVFEEYDRAQPTRKP